MVSRRPRWEGALGVLGALAVRSPNPRFPLSLPASRRFISSRHAFFGIFPAESGLPGRPHYGPEAGEVGLSPREDELLRLVGRAGRGEGEALEELARQVRPLMSAWARAACPERSEAEDVLQESILEFHRSLAGLRDGRALLPWLRRLVPAGDWVEAAEGESAEATAERIAGRWGL